VSTPGPPWGEDSRADELRIASNVVELLRQLTHDAPMRHDPSLRMAHGWHVAVFAGVSSPPLASYLGAPRGSTDELSGYEVVLTDGQGRVLAKGVPAGQVAQALARLESSIRAAVSVLDDVIAPGAVSADADELMAVLRLCARVHGEWVRIHPYANGNGRTARVWANWIALRYGLPPFVRIKPRPDGLLYAQAAHLSMRDGDHALTAQVFVDLLRSVPGRRRAE